MLQCVAVCCSLLQYETLAGTRDKRSNLKDCSSVCAGESAVKRARARESERERERERLCIDRWDFI